MLNKSDFDGEGEEELDETEYECLNAKSLDQED